MPSLQPRTKKFAVDVFRFCIQLPNTPECRHICNQLMRSGSSVGANYRAACHARSRKSFLYKLSIVEEEADESQFWLEILQDLGMGPSEATEVLRQEAEEITRLIVASIKTARKNGQQS